MNKKPLIVIIAIVLIIAVAICGVIFIPKLLKNAPGDDGSSGEVSGIPEMGDGKEFFKITDISEVEPLVTKYGFKMEGPEYDAGMISVYDAECCGVPVQFEFIPFGDEMDTLMNDSYLMSMSCYYIPFSSEYNDVETPKFTHNGNELKGEVVKFFEMLEKVYSVVIDDNYLIIEASDGKLLSNVDDASFERIISNEAFIDFSLRDENGFYWNLRSEITEEGLVYLKFTNYYNSVQYAENITNVTVQ